MAALIKDTFIHDINQPEDSEMRRYEDQMFWWEQEACSAKQTEEKPEACAGLEEAYQKHRKEKPF